MERIATVEALRILTRSDDVTALLASPLTDTLTDKSLSFAAALQEAEEKEAARTSPAVKEKEKLASILSVSVTMPQQLLNLNKILQEYYGLFPDKVSSAQELISDLRDSVSSGVLSYKDAVQKLKSSAAELWDKFVAGGDVNLSRLTGELKNQAVSSHTISSREQLLEEASHLKDLALKNFGLQTEIAASGAEVWVQQVWPIYQAESVLDRDRQRQVPYNPDRHKPEISLADREVKEWDDKFEAEWAQVEHTRISGSDAHAPDNSLNVPSLGNAYASTNPARQSLPESDLLFSQMVKILQTGVDQGNQRLNLELHPDHLGSLKLKLSLSGDELNARILVDNESVRNLLVERMDDLKKAISERGIAFNDLQIACSENSQGNYPDSAVFALRLKENNHLQYPESSENAFLPPQQNVTASAWVV